MKVDNRCTISLSVADLLSAHRAVGGVEECHLDSYCSDEEYPSQEGFERNTYHHAPSLGGYECTIQGALKQSLRQKGVVCIADLDLELFSIARIIKSYKQYIGMCLRSLLFTIVLLGTLSPILAQGLHITGRLKPVQGDRIEVSQVPIRLISLEDKHSVQTRYPDSLGRFAIEVRQGRSYELLIASVVVDTLRLRLNNIVESLQLGDIPIRSKVSTLGEVVVNAPVSSTTGIDKQILYPTREQLAGASNAIDVLGNMMIAGIYIDPSQNRISTARQGKLLVRINGAPASQQDYLRIPPRQIKRIEYHDFPSLRYGDAEAVIDVVLKEPLQGLSFVWNSRNAFHTPWGDIYGDISYNRHRSELGLSISGTIHAYDNQYKEGEEHYRFSGGQTIDRELRGVPSDFEEDYATIALRYGYTEPDKRLFSAKLLYDYWRNDRDNRFLIQDQINGVQAANILSRDHTERYKESKPSFDLYYQRQLGRSVFATNVVGSAFSSSSARKILERYDQHIVSELATTIDGSRYSIIGDVFWQYALGAGQVTTGLNFSTGSNLNDFYLTGTKQYESKLNNYNTYAYAQWRGKYKRLAYALGLGYTLYIQEQEQVASNRSYFITPQVNLAIPLGDNLHARYSGRLRIQRFSTGETNRVEYPMDTYVIHRGNPDLKPYKQLINQLALTFTPKDYRFTFNIFDSYARGGIMERYLPEGGKIVRQLINADKYHQLHLDLGVSRSFFERKLSVGLGLGLKLMQTKSSTYNHRRTALIYNANVAYNHKNWKYWLNCRSHQENLNGEALYRGNGLLNVGIDYRRPRYKVGLGYMTSVSRFTEEKENLAASYRTVVRNINNTFRNTIYLSLSINLHSGKRYNEGERYIYNSDSDSGTLR